MNAVFFQDLAGIGFNDIVLNLPTPSYFFEHDMRFLCPINQLQNNLCPDLLKISDTNCFVSGRVDTKIYSIILPSAIFNNSENAKVAARLPLASCTTLRCPDSLICRISGISVCLGISVRLTKSVV